MLLFISNLSDIVIQFILSQRFISFFSGQRLAASAEVVLSLERGFAPIANMTAGILGHQLKLDA